MTTVHDEEWRWIPCYEFHYKISNYGNVKSYKKKLPKLIYLSNHHGYKKCRLMKRGKAQHFFVHRLVAMTFLNKPEQCTEVNHRDKNRCNNHVDNLEWTTHEQNITHKYGDGTDDVNVIEHDSSRIVAICKSITEAERFTGIAFGTIKKYIDTEMSIKGFRFEKGF